MSEHAGGVIPPAPDPAPTLGPTGATRVAWSPWRAVIGFGVVSLAADMVYEGARSVTGPLLASLGASALVVGLVTGAGRRWRWCCGSAPDRWRTEPVATGP